MPQAMTPGPAPVPYSGPDQAAEPPVYSVPDIGTGMPGDDVMQGVAGNGVQESGYAHDTGAGLVTPYVPGAISPVQAHGDADAGGRDTVAATVGGAVANAEARAHEHMTDTYGQGSTIGDVMTLPPNPLDPGYGSLGSGETLPEGHFYDPPRSY